MERLQGRFFTARQLLRTVVNPGAEANLLEQVESAALRLTIRIQRWPGVPEVCQHPVSCRLVLGHNATAS